MEGLGYRVLIAIGTQPLASVYRWLVCRSAVQCVVAAYWASLDWLPINRWLPYTRTHLGLALGLVPTAVHACVHFTHWLYVWISAVPTYVYKCIPSISYHIII